MNDVDEIVLSYTFFPVDEMEVIARALTHPPTHARRAHTINLRTHAYTRMVVTRTYAHMCQHDTNTCQLMRILTYEGWKRGDWRHGERVNCMCRIYRGAGR